MKGRKRRQLGEQQVSTNAAASGNQLWNSCRSLQREMLGRIRRQTLVSCKAHSRNKHKEILWYFSEVEMWDGIGTLKEILFSFSVKVFSFFSFQYFYKSVEVLLFSIPVA